MRDFTTSGFTDFSDAEQKLATETTRKLKLLAEKYVKSRASRSMTGHIRKQHQHMFGLTLFYESDVNPHSLKRSRAGLILTEKLLGLLNLNLPSGDQMRVVLGQEKRPKEVRSWASPAAKEWEEKLPDGSLGRWWPMPILHSFVGAPESTLRSVLLGMEAMGLVEKKRATNSPKPKMRCKVVRITSEGVAFLKKLEE